MESCLNDKGHEMVWWMGLTWSENKGRSGVRLLIAIMLCDGCRKHMDKLS